MAIRTKTEIINDAIAFIASAVSNIATTVGSVVRDLVIESPAEEFDKIYQELTHTQELQSVAFADNQTTDELDALAANYGMLRLTGKQASGTVTFQIRNYSTSSSNISVPVGTVVSTKSTSSTAAVQFVTTQALLFQASQAPSYFNPSTGLYELTATIAAQNIGISGNVVAGTIVQLVSSIPGITSIVNTVATTGGTDIESNTALGARVQAKLSGNSVGTQAGIIELMKENANVTDALVVTPNDSEMLRSQFGGEVDVYILGNVLTTIFDIAMYTTSGSQEFVLQHQPAKSISSVAGIVGGSPYTFIEGTDYNFVLDTSTLILGSTRMQNKIVFNIGGTNPDNGTNITITYAYDSLIESLQLQLDATSAHIVTSDILVKEAVEATIDITADVSLFPGNSVSDSISAIQTALSDKINVLGLGQSIDRSDVITIIEGVAAVDQVNVSTLVLSKNGTPIPATQQRLQIFKTEYPFTNTITINIV